MDFSLTEETLGYQTSTDPSNTDNRLIIGGSKNVLIDFQAKVRIRPGYTRLGVANTALTPVRNAWTWNTSTGFKAPQRFYDDELEIYLGTIDTYAVDAWKRVAMGWSTTKKLRPTTWFDATENIDLQIMVQGNANLYEWNGAVAIVDSVTANTITKKGTTTFAQNRFYTTRNKTLINVRTGTEFTYAAGESTLTLTTVAGSPIADGMIAGDVLIQKMVTTSDKPIASHTNDVIYTFENQIVVGSYGDEEVYLSHNTSYTTFSFSSPRASGEGALFTLTDPTRAISSLGSILVIFSGRSSLFKIEFSQLAVGEALTETAKVKKLDVGIDQGALNQETVVSIGNMLAYLTNEVALRIINNPEDLTGIDPETFSNPIKPDFDAEDWYDGTTPDAFGVWYKNMLIFSVPQASHMYMLNFNQSADGKTKRFWNPPQILPVGPMSLIDLDDGYGARLYGHSNAIPESYLLFDGASDGQYTDMAVEDKLPIDAKAIFAYKNYDKRAILKTFDEFFAEGEITPNTTDLQVELKYDFDGATQTIQEIIDGSDEDILEGSVAFNSLAQQSLAVNPLGGLLNPPADARKFRVVFEEAKEDFFELGVSFSTNEADRYWAIISHGTNVSLSKKRASNIRK